MANHDNGSGNTCNNKGGLTRSSGTGNFTVTPRFFHNTGTVTIQTGTLDLSGDGTHTGTFDAAGRTVTFTASTNTFDTGSSLTAQQVDVNGGNLTLDAGSYTVDTTRILSATTLTVNTPISFPNVELTLGTFTGSADKTITTSLTWTDGDIGGVGQTLLNGPTGISSAAEHDITSGHIVVNHDTITWSDGNIRMGFKLMNYIL